MDKKTIKIVKRDKGKTTEKPEAVINAREIKSEARLAKIVGKWITERNESRRLEKVFSDDKISGWKSLSEIIKKDK